MTPNNEQKLTAEQILEKHIYLDPIKRPRPRSLVLAAMEEYAAQEAASTQSAGVSKEVDLVEIAEIIKHNVYFDSPNSQYREPDIPFYDKAASKVMDYLASLQSNPKGEVEQKEESERLYQIQFGSNLLCQVQITETGIEIVNAMDGWGNKVPSEGIEITPVPTNQPSPDQEQPE